MKTKIFAYCFVLFSAASTFICAATVARTPLFEFHSAFWVNLHHFVRGQARQQLYENSQSQTQTSISENPGWSDAVDFYTKELANRDLLMDETMPRIKDALEAAEDAQSLSNANIPNDLKTVLGAAAAVYSARYWKGHDQSNRKWIEEASPLTNKYGAHIANRLAGLYKTKWFTIPVRVDLVETAGPNGAYTSMDEHSDMPRITVSSYDPAIRGYYALEILFHESSHAWGKMLFGALDSAAVRANIQLPRGSWHLVLFYTAGEVTRQELSRAGIKDYVPYADKNGVYKDICETCREIIGREWQPYIDGKIDFDTAINRLVAAMQHP